MIRLLALVIGIGAMVALVPVTEHNFHKAQQRFVYATEPPLANLDTRLINIITMGYRLLYDEFAAAWTLQYLDRSTLRGFSGEQAAALLEKTARHRIRVESFYTLSCFVLHLQFKKGMLCEGISQYGIDAIPGGWRVPATFGYIAMSEGDLKKASVYLSIAAESEDLPEMYRRLANRMLSENLSVTERQKFVEAVLTPSREKNDGAARFLVDYLKSNTPEGAPPQSNGESSQ